MVPAHRRRRTVGAQAEIAGISPTGEDCRYERCVGVEETAMELHMDLLVDLYFTSRLASVSAQLG